MINHLINSLYWFFHQRERKQALRRLKNVLR